MASRKNLVKLQNVLHLPALKKTFTREKHKSNPPKCQHLGILKNTKKCMHYPPLWRSENPPLLCDLGFFCGTIPGLGEKSSCGGANLADDDSNWPSGQRTIQSAQGESGAHRPQHRAGWGGGQPTPQQPGEPKSRGHNWSIRPTAPRQPPNWRSPWGGSGFDRQPCVDAVIHVDAVRQPDDGVPAVGAERRHREGGWPRR